jgi:Tol biopolymer transport system component
MVAVVALFCLVLAASAQAAFPGTNGKIAFSRTPCFTSLCDIHVMSVNPDGSGLDEIAPPIATRPAWSADGTKIAYSDGTRIVVANEDGGGASPILDWGAAVEGLAWSPNGGRLVATLTTCEEEECRPDLYVLNSDGTNVIDLTPDLFPDRDPSWSPDGTRIVFSSIRNSNYDIFVVNADGTGAAQLTSGGPDELDPNWSPDGTRIVFEQSSGSSHPIVVMNADGSNRHALSTPQPAIAPAWSPDGSLIAYTAGSVETSIRAIDPETGFDTEIVPKYTGSSYRDFWVDWQPAQAQEPVSGYPRPKGATPLQVPFVPAFTQCTAPNRTHGSPLAFPSCGPPAQQSSFLTVGTPDANGAGAKSTGYLLVRVKETDPQDILWTLTITDVRCRPATNASVCGNPNSAGGPDYAGGIQATMTARLTDHYNGAGLNESATVQDFPNPINASCASTGDPSVGSTCSVTACATCIGPPRSDIGGQRSVVELGQVQVFDGGADGQVATNDNTPFMVQGVFVP